MKVTDFAQCLSSFLITYLPSRNLSVNTIMSYRDTFKLVLIFTEEQYNINAERLTFSKFNDKFVEEFMQWLTKTRNNGISTRNQRLAAIHAFIRYVKIKKPEYLFQNQRILSIPSLKKPQPDLPYLIPVAIKAILDKVDRSNKYGRRDAALLCLLYDSAARVQELADLRVRDIRVDKPYTVTLTGKGNKSRSVPISTNTTDIVRSYMLENRLFAIEKLDYPLFSNHQYHKLTRAGITYILQKYCNLARDETPQIPKSISPHIFRQYVEYHNMGSEE